MGTALVLWVVRAPRACFQQKATPCCPHELHGCGLVPCTALLEVLSSPNPQRFYPGVWWHAKYFFWTCRRSVQHSWDAPHPIASLLQGQTPQFAGRPVCRISEWFSNEVMTYIQLRVICRFLPSLRSAWGFQIPPPLPAPTATTFRNDCVSRFTVTFHARKRAQGLGQSSPCSTAAPASVATAGLEWCSMDDSQWAPKTGKGSASSTEGFLVAFSTSAAHPNLGDWRTRASPDHQPTLLKQQALLQNSSESN